MAILLTLGFLGWAALLGWAWLDYYDSPYDGEE